MGTAFCVKGEWSSVEVQSLYFPEKGCLGWYERRELGFAGHSKLDFSSLGHLGFVGLVGWNLVELEMLCFAVG